MSKIQIKHRFTGAVLFEFDATDEQVKQNVAVREAALAAIKSGVSLAGAHFAGANFAGADFAGANFAGAYFADANFADANFADANLAGANFAYANFAYAYLAGANFADADFAYAYLAGADFAGANLAGAYLADANLAGADFAGANLEGAYLAGADFADANFADANLAGADFEDADFADAKNVPQGTEATSPVEPYKRDTRPLAERCADRAAKFRERNPDVPVVERLDAQILERIQADPGALDMGAWHTCETTHCRAGWAIHLAGERGYELENKYGSAGAGRMIYLASTGRAPNFYATNKNALADIKRMAEIQEFSD